MKNSEDCSPHRRLRARRFGAPSWRDSRLHAKSEMSESRLAFLERVREFESSLQANMGSIFCPTHLCFGHEEVAADIHEHIRADDWLFSTHRNHHHYFAKGGDPRKLWDEIMGIPTGLNGGFSGSQGISDSSINFHASAIVGGLVGVATGTAAALKLDGSDAIAVCCLGDGGTEAGVFWESINFAALHRLPIAYIVENNGKSVDAHITERQATPMKHRAEAFGLSVKNKVESAMKAARAGEPSFCEVKVKLTCDHLNMSTMMPTKFDLVARTA